MASDRLLDPGSSPLTRGKQESRCTPPQAKRLIPAHAGKTNEARHGGVDTPAHPRSRGENDRSPPLTACALGSSPLTRGKPHKLQGERKAQRLIPAHAGKTLSPSTANSSRWAHPRSRGENWSGVWTGIQTMGSSPLTRGKQAVEAEALVGERLIPAHAGKTSTPLLGPATGKAHPRSRGENYGVEIELFDGYGSSPLTRGKRGLGGLRRRGCRLIPAHAGKTRGRCARNRTLPAHPRSRGENRMTSCASPPVRGSSPLTRGKRTWLPRGSGGRRLIPAHAGKTLKTSQIVF